MAGDLRRWDDDCIDELCDIVFGQFLLGNFAEGLSRVPLWDVITHTLNARTRKEDRWGAENERRREGEREANEILWEGREEERGITRK